MNTPNTPKPKYGDYLGGREIHDELSGLLIQVRDECGRIIVEIDLIGVDAVDGARSANVKRVCACWNFCAGVPSDALKPLGLASSFRPLTSTPLVFDYQRT